MVAAEINQERELRIVVACQILVEVGCSTAASRLRQLAETVKVKFLV